MKFLKDKAFSQSKSDKNSGKGRENMKFLKDRAFSQFKSDKKSGKGRENMKNKGKTVFFISPSVTKIPRRAEKT